MRHDLRSMWGLEVNSISVINMIMAIGLVVDYSVSPLLAFRKCFGFL